MSAAMTPPAPTFESGTLTPVGRPIRELAKDCLLLYKGRQDFLFKEMRMAMRADPNWLPTRGEAGLILAVMSDDSVKNAAAEGFEFHSERQAATAAWMEMAALQRGEQRKKAKRLPWES